jgi:hypothetical protein
MNSFSRSEF